jgi:hypothetical protein
MAQPKLSNRLRAALLLLKDGSPFSDNYPPFEVIREAIVVLDTIEATGLVPDSLRSPPEDTG